MTITIETTAELDRAISHLLAYDNFKDVNVGMTPNDYLMAELNSKLSDLISKAVGIRKIYVSEVSATLSADKFATLAEQVYVLANT